MIFRRIIAGLLVFLFIAVSLVTFLVFAVSNTFFSGTFYEEKISGDAYSFMVSATVKNLMNENNLLEKYFTEADLRRDIIEVFPEEIFVNNIKQLVSENGDFKAGSWETDHFKTWNIQGEFAYIGS